MTIQYEALIDRYNQREASLDIQVPEYGLLTKCDREFRTVAVRLSSLVEREWLI